MIQDADWALEQKDREITRGEWASVLALIARQHRDALIRLEVATPAGRVVEVEARRLKDLSVDSAGNEQRIYVQVGNAGEGDLTYTVEDPTRLVLQREGIEIVSADGKVTSVRFRQAIGPGLDARVG